MITLSKIISNFFAYPTSLTSPIPLEFHVEEWRDRTHPNEKIHPIDDTTQLCNLVQTIKCTHTHGARSYLRRNIPNKNNTFCILHIIYQKNKPFFTHFNETTNPITRMCNK